MTFVMMVVERRSWSQLMVRMMMNTMVLVFWGYLRHLRYRAHLSMKQGHLAKLSYHGILPAGVSLIIHPTYLTHNIAIKTNTDKKSPPPRPSKHLLDRHSCTLTSRA